MPFGVDVSQHQLEWSEILRRAQLAEELGSTASGSSITT